MSLSIDHPHLETGDATGALSCWEVEGLSFDNNDHGRVYIRKNGVNVEAAKDRAFVNVVSSGADVAPGAALVLLPQNSSGLTVRAIRGPGDLGTGTTPPSVPITVWFFLANEADLRRKDNQLSTMLLRNEVDFLLPMLDTMNEFLTRMSAIYPPPPNTGYPNDFVKAQVESGRSGSQEWYAQFFWSLSAIGDFEITGLQNPGDYRHWFLNQCLALIYARKARTGDTSDPIYSRQVGFQMEADRLWRIVKPWVDVDRNQVGDRQPKIRNVRLTRG